MKKIRYTDWILECNHRKWFLLWCIFFYGVKTTKIFCRPSCKSRIPNIENVYIFHNIKQAQFKTFRPRKRCKPDSLCLPNEEWTQQIVEYINLNYHEQLTLNKLANIYHGSPYHLQRTLKKVKGISPLAYIQQVRITKAMFYLVTSNKNIIDIGIDIGIPNPTYFITFFKKKTGLTPTDYRKKTTDEEI